MKKRILFVTPAGYGHLFPIIPLIWALKTRGETVELATCGVSLSLAAKAGLEAMNVAPNIDLPALFIKYRDNYRSAFYHPRPQIDVWGAWQHSAGSTIFTALGEAMLPGVLEAIEAVHPDLVVYTPYAAAGPIAASAAKIPSVFQGIALAYTPNAMFAGTYSRMREICARVGVDRIDPPLEWINIAPPTLSVTDGDGWPMRYIPYCGGDIIGTRSVSTMCSRPRLAVTLGTVVPQAEGLKSLRWIVELAPELDIDVIIAHGSANAMDLGKLPPNVKAVSWFNLDRLFAQSTAAVHHGGPGTMFAALNAVLPQLVMPKASDQFYNAAALARAGCALVPSDPESASQALRVLIRDSDSLRSSARRISEEISRMPTPAELCENLVARI